MWSELQPGNLFGHDYRTRRVGTCDPTRPRSTKGPGVRYRIRHKSSHRHFFAEIRTSLKTKEILSERYFEEVSFDSNVTYTVCERRP